MRKIALKAVSMLSNTLTKIEENPTFQMVSFENV